MKIALLALHLFGAAVIAGTTPVRAGDFDDFFSATLAKIHSPIRFGQCGNRKVALFMFFPADSNQGTMGEFQVSNPVVPGMTLLNTGDVALKPYIELSNVLQGGAYNQGEMTLDLEYIRQRGLKVLQPKDFKNIMVEMPTYECPDWTKQYGYDGPRDIERIYKKMGWGKSAFDAFYDNPRSGK